MEKKTRWSSGFGFIMAAAGASIGLGNIWGFPYRIGQGGGFVFLVCYLVFVFLIGYPILLGEFALGRRFRRGAVGAFGGVAKPFRAVGAMGILACFIVLCYYIYFGGVIIHYVVQYMENLALGGGHGTGMAYLEMTPGHNLLWMAVFIGLTLFIVLRGVQSGIEACAKVMLPALFIFLIYLAGRSLRLEGAGEALRYLFWPDWSKLSADTLTSALTQVFFSLSIGQGIMVTYGSYLDKKQSLEQCAAVVPLFDTAAALLSGLVIIPAVFSFGMDPAAGPGLMFDAMPRIFAGMAGGNVLGLMFFLLLLMAAITSSISMLETLASAFNEELGMKKSRASLLVALVVTLCAVPICLSPGTFSLYEFVAQNVLVTIGALLTCLIIAWYWKPGAVRQEVTAEGGRFVTWPLWRVLIRYVTPVLVVMVVLLSMGVIG